MKNAIHSLLAICMSVFAAACTCESEEAVERTQLQTQKKVQGLLDEFYASTCKSSRATGSEGLVVYQLEKRNYTMSNGIITPSTPDSRSRAQNTDITFSISLAKFQKKDGKRGYAVLSDDPKINKIFCFMEEGNISDTTSIPPLKALIDTIPYLALEELKYSRSQTARSTVSPLTIGPVSELKWDQYSPFNSYMPTCSCNNQYAKGHNLTGCVSIATAQYIATCGTFTGTFYGNKNIDFKELSKRPYPLTGEWAMMRNIAQFVHEVAICCQTKFGCNASSSHPKAAYHYLQDLGYDCNYTENGLDLNLLREELEKGYPHIIGAKEIKSGKNHCWLITGYMQKTDGSKYVYHNWGHLKGDSNGWTLSNTFVEAPKSDSLIYRGNYVQIYTKSTKK